MKSRPMILLDETECLYKLCMASKVSFGVVKGTASIFKVNVNDPVFIIRYKLGERNFETGLMNVAMLPGDFVESNGRLYRIETFQRCSDKDMVFVECSLADIPENRAA